MHVQPDAASARADRGAVTEMLAAVLDKARVQLSETGARFGLSPDTLVYPGVFAAAYETQAACRSARPSPAECERLADRLHDAVERARTSEGRMTSSGCPAWAVDLAPPEDHLQEALARAVSQVPQRPDRDLTALHIGDWSEADRAAFCDASCLLAGRWPEMLNELTEVVSQIVLLDGFGVNGFTDVATHGAIYVNRTRLGPDDAGLPGAMRMAEAIVHEGTHNSCNAAALAKPFIADATSVSEPVMMTPLRRDPRPLTGLLQQLVVLVRSVLLYDRLLDSSGTPAPAVARRDTLRGQAGEALRVISAHTTKLTQHGRTVVTDAADLLARSAVESAA